MHYPVMKIQCLKLGRDGISSAVCETSRAFLFDLVYDLKNRDMATQNPICGHILIRLSRSKHLRPAAPPACCHPDLHIPATSPLPLIRSTHLELQIPF